MGKSLVLVSWSLRCWRAIGRERNSLLVVPHPLMYCLVFVKSEIGAGHELHFVSGYRYGNTTVP